MKILLLTELLLFNAVFACACGWMEGVMDHTFYYTETIAGHKKHQAYKAMRIAYWITNWLLIVNIYTYLEAVVASAVTIGVMLAHFRYLHDGMYHHTRNQLNPNVSTKGFFNDGDGLSHSGIDQLLGDSYLQRNVIFWIGNVFYVALLICLTLNVFQWAL